MSEDGSAALRTGFWTSVLSLFASSSTLVCCALPALLVALGAGAALSSLVAVVPQVVWLSEHKLELFSVAGAALLIGGWLQWRNRSAPCPLEPALRAACMRTRATSFRLYAWSLAVYGLGGWFAFAQPLLG